MALGVDSDPSENEYQEHFLGVKVAGEWTTSLPLYAESHENLPKPPGTLWATPGL